MYEEETRNLAGKKLLNREQMHERIGWKPSNSHLWRMEKQGKFPARVRLSYSKVCWVESEIDEWINERIEKRNKAMNDRKGGLK
jgi:prophage regulatory protein